MFRDHKASEMHCFSHDLVIKLMEKDGNIWEKKPDNNTVQGNWRR